MPLKGEARTRYIREYMRKRRAAERAAKAAGKSPERAHGRPAAEPRPDHAALAQAHARIHELEAELAQAKARIVVEEAAAVGVEPTGKVFKILLKLDDANDHTVLVAARTLVNNLKANGSDLRTLANALEAEYKKQQKAKPAPPPVIDWSKVDAAIDRHVADQATVKINVLLKALHVDVPDLKRYRGRYVADRLRRLGFTASSSGLTWSR